MTKRTVRIQQMVGIQSPFYLSLQFTGHKKKPKKQRHEANSVCLSFLCILIGTPAWPGMP